MSEDEGIISETHLTTYRDGNPVSEQTTAEIMYNPAYGPRPIITSRVTYVDDIAEGRWVECEIEMRSGAKAFGRINPKQLARDAPPEFWDRVSLVHATLLFWGVGDVSWHRRDVGRCACMLLAMTLPQDREPFAAAIASPDALAGYLTSGA